MANLRLVEYPCQPNFSNHTKLNLKTFIYLPMPVVKTQLEVTVWPHFPFVVRPIRHSSFYNGQFSIKWVPLANNLLRSHHYPNVCCKNSITSYYMTSISLRCPATPSVFFYNKYVHKKGTKEKVTITRHELFSECLGVK